MFEILRVYDHNPTWLQPKANVVENDRVLKTYDPCLHHQNKKNIHPTGVCKGPPVIHVLRPYSKFKVHVVLPSIQSSYVVHVFFMFFHVFSWFFNFTPVRLFFLLDETITNLDHCKSNLRFDVADW